MSQTATIPDDPAASEPATRGFLLPCPKCGEQGATIDLHLNDLSFRCQDCDTEFEAAAVREFIARWSAVLTWIDAAPQLPSA